MKLLYLDCETTGIDPFKNGLIQVAGLLEIDGEVKEEFNFKCRPFPGKLISEDALKANGVTLEELKVLPDPKEVYQKLLAIFDKYVDRYAKEDKFYQVGQNTKFDYDFLSQWFKDNGNKYFYAYVRYHLIDLIQATALFHVAGKMNLVNMKLETVAQFFRIDFKAHDALEDIKTARKIFYRYVELMKQIDVERIKS